METCYHKIYLCSTTFVSPPEQKHRKMNIVSCRKTLMPHGKTSPEMTSTNPLIQFQFHSSDPLVVEENRARCSPLTVNPRKAGWGLYQDL